MRAVPGKHGNTIISSRAYQLYDRIRHENGIYERDLTEQDKLIARDLVVSGTVKRVTYNGETKLQICKKTD